MKALTVTEMVSVLVRPSLRLSVCISAAPIRRVYVKIDVREFSESLSRNSSCG